MMSRATTVLKLYLKSPRPYAWLDQGTKGRPIIQSPSKLNVIHRLYIRCAKHDDAGKLFGLVKMTAEQIVRLHTILGGQHQTIL